MECWKVKYLQLDFLVAFHNFINVPLLAISEGMKPTIPLSTLGKKILSFGKMKACFKEKINWSIITFVEVVQKAELNLKKQQG